MHRTGKMNSRIEQNAQKDRAECTAGQSRMHSKQVKDATSCSCCYAGSSSHIFIVQVTLLLCHLDTTENAPFEARTT